MTPSVEKAETSLSTSTIGASEPARLRRRVEEGCEAVCIMRGFGEGMDVSADESLRKDMGLEVVSETGCLRFAVWKRSAESVYQPTVWGIYLEHNSPIEVTVPSSAISAATNFALCFPILDSDVKVAEHKPSSEDRFVWTRSDHRFRRARGLLIAQSQS